MMSLPVEEPPDNTSVRLKINYNRITTVLDILLISACIIKKVNCLVAVAFLGHPVHASFHNLNFRHITRST